MHTLPLHFQASLLLTSIPPRSSTLTSSRPTSSVSSATVSTVLLIPYTYTIIVAGLCLVQPTSESTQRLQAHSLNSIRRNLHSLPSAAQRLPEDLKTFLDNIRPNGVKLIKDQVPVAPLSFAQFSDAAHSLISKWTPTNSDPANLRYPLRLFFLHRLLIQTMPYLLIQLTKHLAPLTKPGRIFFGLTK